MTYHPSLSMHVTPYWDRLQALLNKGLSDNFGYDKPHALHLTLHGDKARLLDFGTWRKTGHGSHKSVGIRSENDTVREALSIAAFEIADGGGFIGALPRGAYKQPTYYFLTHCIVAFDRTVISNVSAEQQSLQDVGDALYTAQSAGSSAHTGLLAHQQITTVLSTLFPKKFERIFSEC